MLKTTNGGVNWTALNAGTSEMINSVFFFNENTGIICCNSGVIKRTIDGGANWNSSASGTTSHLYAISFSNNNNGICCGSSGTLLWTTNSGVNWSVAVEGFLSSYYGIHMVDANTGYAAGVNTIFAPLIARTTNGGMNWNYSSFYINSNEGNLRDIHFLSGTEGFAVSNVWNGQGGISYTTNAGSNWTSQLFTSALNSLDFPTGNIGYAVGYSGSILKTTDRGASWVSQTSGISDILRSIDFVDSLTGYATGDNGRILKTTNGGVTALNGNTGTIPDGFALHQNYPNPFNPGSKIKYQLSRTSPVRISVFDVLGCEIAILIHKIQKPGVYEIDFDGSKYPSGIYFYILEAGDYRETRKMMLVK